MHSCYSRELMFWFEFTQKEQPESLLYRSSQVMQKLTHFISALSLKCWWRAKGRICREPFASVRQLLCIKKSTEIYFCEAVLRYAPTLSPSLALFPSWLHLCACQHIFSPFHSLSLLSAVHSSLFFSFVQNCNSFALNQNLDNNAVF